MLSAIASSFFTKTRFKHSTQKNLVRLTDRLFAHTTLISIVFSRRISALLVAPLQFRATKCFVSLHCIALRCPSARKAGSLRFGGAVLLSLGRGKESNPAPSNETQNNEHDRKLILNASTAEQHCQAHQVPPTTTGIQNRFIERMSDTCRHPTMRYAGTGSRLLEHAHRESSLFQSRM